MVLGIEVGEAGVGPDVAEDDVRVDVGVEVPDALVVPAHRVRERRHRLRVAGVAAPPVVRGRPLHAVAVDVHVGQRPARPLLVDYPVAV